MAKNTGFLEGTGQKLDGRFYRGTDVVRIAKALLGKGLFTRINGVVTGGVIVETEAYSWLERGCHAYGARKTERNAIMFGEGGYAYVYLCYGMHNLFNVVTNQASTAEAVLIRALEPLTGIDHMMKRRGVSALKQLTSGPGRLTKALGIDRGFNGKYLLDNEVWLEDLGKQITTSKIAAGKRIGIDYAGADADLPWRFVIKNNPFISRK